MSKDIPEVGDIWKKGNYLYNITNVEKYEFSVGATISYINNNLITNFKDLKSFQRCFTYIGKSKANIDDLFKTENEE